MYSFKKQDNSSVTYNQHDACMLAQAPVCVRTTVLFVIRGCTCGYPYPGSWGV